MLVNTLEANDICNQITKIFDKVWKWWNTPRECGNCQCCDIHKKKN